MDPCYQLRHGGLRFTVLAPQHCRPALAQVHRAARHVHVPQRQLGGVQREVEPALGEHEVAGLLVQRMRALLDLRLQVVVRGFDFAAVSAQAREHLIEGARQLSDLVVTPHIDALVQVAGRDTACSLHQPAHRRDARRVASTISAAPSATARAVASAAESIASRSSVPSESWLIPTRT